MAMRTIGLISLVLFGCSGSEEEVQRTEVAKGESEGVIVEVAGAMSERFKSRASFFCTKSEFGDGQEIELYARAAGQMVNLRIPRRLSIGDHAVIGPQDSPGLTLTQPQLRYQHIHQRKTFDRNGRGVFSLGSQPAVIGDVFQAQIEAELSDRDGNTVQLKIAVDVPAGHQTFDECAGAA